MNFKSLVLFVLMFGLGTILANSVSAAENGQESFRLIEDPYAHWDQ